MKEGRKEGGKGKEIVFKAAKEALRLGAHAKASR